MLKAKDSLAKQNLQLHLPHHTSTSTISELETNATPSDTKEGERIPVVIERKVTPAGESEENKDDDLDVVETKLPSAVPEVKVQMRKKVCQMCNIYTCDGYKDCNQCTAFEYDFKYCYSSKCTRLRIEQKLKIISRCKNCFQYDCPGRSKCTKCTKTSHDYCRSRSCKKKKQYEQINLPVICFLLLFHVTDSATVWGWRLIYLQKYTLYLKQN